MCTQQLIWCSCGHGELLPIVRCTHGHLTGACWTIIHGDHRIVVASACSYCKLGLNSAKHGRVLKGPRPVVGGHVDENLYQNAQSSSEGDHLQRTLDDGELWSMVEEAVTSAAIDDGMGGEGDASVKVEHDLTDALDNNGDESKTMMPVDVDTDWGDEFWKYDSGFS